MTITIAIRSGKNAVADIATALGGEMKNLPGGGLTQSWGISVKGTREALLVKRDALAQAMVNSGYEFRDYSTAWSKDRTTIVISGPQRSGIASKTADSVNGDEYILAVAVVFTES